VPEFRQGGKREIVLELSVEGCKCSPTLTQRENTEGQGSQKKCGGGGNLVRIGGEKARERLFNRCGPEQPLSGERLLAADGGGKVLGTEHNCPNGGKEGQQGQTTKKKGLT